jgi:hypothetical protein
MLWVRVVRVPVPVRDCRSEDEREADESVYGHGHAYERERQATATGCHALQISLQADLDNLIRWDSEVPVGGDRVA